MRIADLCSDLVHLRSENPPGDTRTVVHYLHTFLESLGVKAQVVEGDSTRWNLVFCPDPQGLLLCGHIDTVPVSPNGWSHQPFSGLQKDGYIWGRGSSDMKGGCAALLAAIQSLVERDEEPWMNLAFVCDEETGGEFGIRYLLAKKIFNPRDCLIAEPTPPMNPSVGQKGLCRLDISFEGVPGHGSLHPVVGRSAVMEAVELITYLKEMHEREYLATGELGTLIERSAAVLQEVFGVTDGKKVLQHITFNPGTIHGGEKVNVVAQHCQLGLDLRIPWGYTVDQLIGEISAHAPHATVVGRDCSDPNYTSPQSPLVSLICREVERVMGKPAVPIVQWAASDAKFLRDQGCQVVEYGPGELPTLHAIDERISIEGLESAATIYAGFLDRYRNLYHS
ncbi:MAG: ArgE/DapE family deacylase [Methanomicrobiales archaeon]|nr:ArgE/DapE family deacylase [Methanomicrobiales archaeon]